MLGEEDEERTGILHGSALVQGSEEYREDCVVVEVVVDVYVLYL